MNKYSVLSFMCFIVGIAFFVIGFLTGEIQGGILVVFPFIVGSGLYALAGFIMISIAILLFIFGFTRNIQTEENYYDLGEPAKKSSVKGGGVVLIWPIPIVFGSNWKIAILLMILSIILIVTMFFFLRFI
ncbi:MAG: DUF131 domain-containing protein [Candidatus Thermoplasmatota archaeon]|jgi:uncharacterized protein (TIGR00304 family)|nr:DUF131 domain-containing protein [Candidatus Thermoplasmatota archaeon]